MARISVYVSDELKQRMDALGERTNWSSIAKQAFEAEINRIASRKDVNAMTDAIERLKASKQEVTNRAMKSGENLGAEWVKSHAQYDELKRFDAFVQSGGVAGNLKDDVYPGLSAAHLVYEAVTGDSHPDNEDLASFLCIEQDAVEEITPDFVKAFVKGAEETWAELARHI